MVPSGTSFSSFNMARISSNHFTEARIASSFLPDDLTNSTKRARRLLSWADDAFASRFSNDMKRVTWVVKSQQCESETRQMAVADRQQNFSSEIDAHVEGRDCDTKGDTQVEHFVVAATLKE